MPGYLIKLKFKLGLVTLLPSLELVIVRYYNIQFFFPERIRKHGIRKEDILRPGVKF